MKILEVRDGFIKFESDNSVSLSSFVLVSGISKEYIAQIVQIKRSGIDSIAVAKILFLYDGSLQPYDRTLPPNDAEIKDFTFDILSNSIKASEPVIVGEMQNKELDIVIDASSFNKKMLMSIDDRDENNILVRNLVKQFNNLKRSVVIIDTLGVINARKAVAGVDFKLPLDTASLAFMYEDCLNDATADSKSLIIEIFRDLAEYSRTVPFVPFGALKSIVDDMVDKSHVFKLLVLKNKLAKFDRMGYFAKDKQEVDKIEKILNSKCIIIDLSKLDSAFQNRYLAFLYEKLKERENTQIFLELSNSISKKNLKNILDGSCHTTFITHSKFKYLNDIKNLFDNFIISPSLTNNEIFKIYNTLLKSMQRGTYLISGEAVNYIPLVSSAKIIDKVIPQEESAAQNIVLEKDQSVEPVLNAASDEQTGAKLETSPTEMVSNLEEQTESVSSSEADSEGEGAILNEITDEKADVVKEAEETNAGSAPVVPEIVEEEVNRISNEEILANIAEKSESVISDAAKDLTPISGNMFEGDDTEEESYENSEDLEVIEESEEAEGQEEFEALVEPEEVEEQQELEDQEEILLQTVEEISEESDEFIHDELTDEASVDLMLEELSQSQDIDSDDNYDETTDFESLQEYSSDIIPEGVDELSLEESFRVDAEEEIQDYIPVDESIEAFSTEPEADEFSFVDETDLQNFDSITEENENDSEDESESEIELPEGFDFDMDSSNNDVPPDSSFEMDSIMPELEINVLPASEKDEINLDEIVELDPDEAGENDIVIDMTEDETDATVEDLDEQIVKDVDKVFTTRKDDDISDSDLDFIDELNSDDGVLEEFSDEESVLDEISTAGDDGILEDASVQFKNDNSDRNDDILETRNSSTPIVPVYDADIPQEDMVISDPIQQGDTVTHAKYGSGVVEKMIKYGNKTLFSINFDNIGRRLLDPTLTEIKKLS